MILHSLLAALSTLLAHPHGAGELASKADLRVLLLGSTRTAGALDGGESAANHAASPAEIAAQLQAMLTDDRQISGAVEVVFEDVYRTRTVPTAIGQRGEVHDLEYHCHSLAQYYFWPDGREERLSDLRGEAGRDWDHVVLIGDPHLLACLPGLYAEGVFLIADAVLEGEAQPMLLIPPIDAEGQATAERIAAVVGRVGSGAGIPVIPAGPAWRELHTTSDAWEPGSAAYLSAACIYSQIRGRSPRRTDRPGEPDLGDLAQRIVRRHRSPGEQDDAWSYASPFAMARIEGQHIEHGHTGTSSELGIQRSLAGVLKACGLTQTGHGPRSRSQPRFPLDVNLGRGNRSFEEEKRYRPDPERCTLSFGFPMQDHAKTARTSMLYGIDWRTGIPADDGTDLGIANTMLREELVDLGGRCIPIRLLWAKLHDARPALEPLGDKWHMSRQLNEASAAFLVTLLTGRCPLGAEPDSADERSQLRWQSRKIGYETAWRMANLEARAPGFRVVPPKPGALVLERGGKTSLAVAFAGTPRESVTVRISVEGAGRALVKPRRLTFPPRNHGQPQQVKITVKGGGSAPSLCTIALETESRDGAFDGLRAAWTYTVRQ